MIPTDSTISGARRPGLDPAAFRDAMARFPSGVAIVTTRDEDGVPHGFTASSFCSVSADPALVLVCLATSAACYPVFERAEHFAISILGEAHVEVARRFASKSADKFGPGGFVRTPGGGTVLDGAPAVVECAARSRHSAGDHVIMVGEVGEVHLAAAGRPAVYFQRGFNTLCPSGREAGG
ncbi:flavin reductase family protein [Allonocardiopsis opalescens]|uniref:Flavin reductase ActVB n=1 Tax=Allonocardiopsis opalescens TaxID=1144618 RepID=A0A2T0Q5P2_9ACTN|nr:flavin reductase family protein [Allonocardiopsis opalescens]PRX99099.1 flavin reductase ActVB [Allonocardiopsis opalescens]